MPRFFYRKGAAGGVNKMAVSQKQWANAIGTALGIPKKAAQDTKDETRHIHQHAQHKITPCVHSFYGSDMLCIKCGKYFPETNEA
jgi:hypothetical protein